jgi:hypothetical protein
MFKSHEAFKAQLARRFMSLSDINKKKYTGYANGNSAKVLREVSFGASQCLGTTLRRSHSTGC